MKASPYRRTPLPPAARPRPGWLFLCIAALMASPFIGFAIHGKVAEPGLMIGLAIMVVPLTGLALLAVARWYALRQVPPSVLEEWRRGRVVPAAGAPAVQPPARFSHGKAVIEMRPEGLVASRHALLRMPGSLNTLENQWVVEQAGQFFVPWSDITEWVVDTDSDGPDYYQLELRGKGFLSVRRFQPVEGSESDLLDAVRSVGRLPVRLCCDIGQD